MSRDGSVRSPLLRHAVVWGLGGLILLASTCMGCGSSSSATPPSTTYAGVLTGTGGTSGTVSFTIDRSTEPIDSQITQLGSNIDTVVGTLRLTGVGNAILVGTFAPPAGPLIVSSSGYACSGALQDGALSGTWTGSGYWGLFSALAVNGAGSVTNYCGTFAGTDSGTWNLSESGTTIAGSFSGSIGVAALNGSLQGVSISLAASSGATAQGTLDGTSMGGTWSSGSHNGTWAASTTTCN